MKIPENITKIFSKISLPKIKLIDQYIIRKFLGTYFLSIILIILIAIVFDTAEKLDDFMNKHAPLNAIVFHYYMNFAAYFAVLYSHLFTFIAAVFFTSKMAYRTEIIAILASGVSYRRLLMSYFAGALIIAAFNFTFANFVVPRANKVRLEFEERYIRDSPVNFDNRNFHKQIRPGIVIYMESYSNLSNAGYKFSIEKYKNGLLESKLMAEYLNWDSAKNKWTARDYFIRDISEKGEKIKKGASIDTTLFIYPADFKKRDNNFESMNLFELIKFINDQKLSGSAEVNIYLIEKYRRYAAPLITLILTLIAVSLSSRKVRGGTGLHIGIGMGICFSYIIFLQFSTQFAIKGSLPPMLAVWLPNIVYSFIGVYLYWKAPK